MIQRSKNRCERCNIDFDDSFKGEFHHIIPLIFGGNNKIENCILLCHNCHLAAPNIKDEKDRLIMDFARKVKNNDR